jgi:hypothetical protein
MLENLNAVSWEQLRHAYGSAADVPDLILLLAEGDEEARQRAIWDLNGNIFHQGTRYEATPHVVPFLIELVGNEKTPDKEAVLYLLISLALGYEDDFLPEGFDPIAFRRNCEKTDTEMSSEKRAACKELASGPLIDIACYDAVEKAVPVFLRLFDDPDPKVRRAAAYTLAWFPNKADESIPKLLDLEVKATETATRAVIYIALGLLMRFQPKKEDELILKSKERLTSTLNNDASLILRASAATALAGQSDDARINDVLLEATMSPDQLQEWRDEIRFNGGNLSGYVALTLAHGDPGARDRVVRALCETLKCVNPYESIDITRSLLELLVAERATWIKDIPLDTLTTLEIEALTAIAEHGGWEIEGATFANYCQVVRAFGVPDTQEKLSIFLGKTNY